MRRPIQSALLSLSLFSLASSLGCGNDTTGPTPLDPAHLYFQLTLNHHAITMALTVPYNTIQLVATPRSATGALLTDTSTTTYTVDFSNDVCGCQSVTISPTGLLTADSVDVNAVVIARHTIGNVTKTDTAFVNVNDVNPVPVFTTLALQPLPGDSAYMSVSDVFSQLVPVALDQNKNQIDNFRVYIRNTNTLVFGYNNVPRQNRKRDIINLIPNNPGKTLLVAEATVYGISLTDTLLYTVGWPITGSIAINSVTPAGRLTPIGVFSPHDDTVAASATVFWLNQMQGQSVDVVFDNPATVQAADSALASQFYVIPSQGGGNIPAFAAMDSTQGQDTLGVRARRFPTAGTYIYHSVLYGTTGVLHVVPEFQVP